MFFASLIGKIIDLILDSNEPDLESVRQALLDAQRKVSDAIARKDIGG